MVDEVADEVADAMLDVEAVCQAVIAAAETNNATVYAQIATKKAQIATLTNQLAALSKLVASNENARVRKARRIKLLLEMARSPQGMDSPIFRQFSRVG